MTVSAPSPQALAVPSIARADAAHGRTVQMIGGVIAADTLNFAVRSGEFRCIIGPNGAGKSTLFTLLCAVFTGRTLDASFSRTWTSRG